MRTRVELLAQTSSPRRKEAARTVREAKVQVQSKRVGILVKNRHMSTQRSKKKVFVVDDHTTERQVGSQDTTVAGALGSYF